MIIQTGEHIIQVHVCIDEHITGLDSCIEQQSIFLLDLILWLGQSLQSKLPLVV